MNIQMNKKIKNEICDLIQIYKNGTSIQKKEL